MTLEELIINSGIRPRIAVVLGSGLGTFADKIDVSAVADYKVIEGFLSSGVSGHAGKLIIGLMRGVGIAAMCGRVHYYEGYAMRDVVRPIRLLRDAGIETVILTNASGGVNEIFERGDIMAITDHIMTVPNPLIGANDERYGVRFPDMSEVYDGDLIKIAERAALEVGVDLKKGVYAQFSGPSYETPAEIRALRILGVDAVGMSTAAEAVTARHAGMKVLGLSLVANAAANGITKLSHEDVKASAESRSAEFAELLEKIIVKLK